MTGTKAGTSRGPIFTFNDFIARDKKKTGPETMLCINRRRGLRCGAFGDRHLPGREGEFPAKFRVWVFAMRSNERKSRPCTRRSRPGRGPGGV